MELYIIKRDGKKELFSVEKIKSAVAKAFLSVGSFATQEVLCNILCRVSIKDGISVEEIQNQVEIALMSEKYYAVAKAYMLYRQKHAEDREVTEKLKFLMEYCEASNAATGSKFDSNANVENKNMATLIGANSQIELHPTNRRLLTDRLKDMYGKELADRYIELLNNHFIYKNDETSLANYCASITMYPWLISGTASIGGNSKAPTNLKSFCGGFINMVFMVSSMLSGACATPEFLMYMNYFIGLEFGEDYYKETDKIVDLSKKQRTLDKIITDYFEQIVYSINQPTGARNFQAVLLEYFVLRSFLFRKPVRTFCVTTESKTSLDSLNWLQKPLHEVVQYRTYTCVLTCSS
jgi:ribonucleoside-triphosphate reductase